MIYRRIDSGALHFIETLDGEVPTHGNQSSLCTIDHKSTWLPWVYLRSCRRLHVLREDQPLWTRHDGAGEPGAQLSSWSFVENLKRYAREAGIGKIHLHQTRHTFARMVTKRSGSLSETQDALGHRHASTTRIYIDSIAVKTDK